MIWIHCGTDNEIRATCSLVNRLAEGCDASEVLITTLNETFEAFDDLPAGTTIVQIPAETQAKTRAFLDSFAPESLIWNGGTLRPVLLRAVAQDGMRATLINANAETLIPRAARWMPRAARTAVAAFDHILTANGATATRLIRGGVARDRVQATGPILEDPMPLPHDQYELTVMAEALDTRPVWFAADILAQEVAPIAAAHIAASRKSHRLLLLITPRDLSRGPQFAGMLRENGLKVGVRSDGDDPEQEHQVYIADLPNELGLWYRIAPLTFLGATLSGGEDAASPFDPVLLGSAVVHGTFRAPHTARFERLAKTEACREVRSASELGIAVSTLISPEHTARMALAGWEEITRNAETINHLIKLALGTGERTR